MSCKSWSSDRPKRPDVDPDLRDLRGLLRADKRSTWAKANVSGLSPGTIANIASGKTRRPQHVTMIMAYRMLGFRMEPVPIGRKGK